MTYPALADASSLKRELVEGLDIMILRELTGGVYFGEPKTITDLGNGQKRAIDTQVYDTYEIERIGRVAFELARKRRNKVTSMEKRNVMKTGVLWNEVMTALHAREFKDVQLEHMLADAGGMQLVRKPKQFDVIVTDNLFGDMLSDIAAMLTGSLGMLASASLGEVDPKTKKRKALYEPVHGSAPDIAGKGIANPIAMIASFGMALRYSFDLGKQADMIDQAIAATLAKGLRTADIKSEGTKVVSTSEMGDAILAELETLAALTKNAAARAAFSFCVQAPPRIADQGLFLNGSVNGPGSADLVAAEGRVVEHAGGVLIGQLRVIVAGVLAREGFGAGIEIRPLLNDDAGAGAAVFVAAHEHRMARCRRDHALLLRRRIGRRGQQGRWRAAAANAVATNFQAHGVLAGGLYCNAV